MQCEESEHHDNSDSDLSAPEDPFVAEGLSSSSDPDVATSIAPLQTSTCANRLQAGKAHCENLKEKLFHSKAHHIHHNRRTRAEQHGLVVHLSNSDSDSDIE
jgi:hypothetical protein